MNRKHHTRPGIVAVLALALSVAVAAPALADNAAAEQQHGAQILNQIQYHKLNPKSLTSDQYHNLGEYLMGQALGSTQLHQRMDTLMDEMMGPAAADQMHIYLGRRYLGINATPSRRYTQLYGLMGTMMSGYGYRGSALAGMMSRYLDGQGVAGYPVGPGMMGYADGYTPAVSSKGGWPTAAIVATAALGALLIGGGIAFAAPKLRRRTHRATAATS
jgi:hypothetical protein